MVKKQDNVVRIEQLEENVKKQTEYAKKSYADFLEMNRKMIEQTLNAFDSQVEIWLSMQLGYLDMLQNIMGFRPDLKEYGTFVNPFSGQFEHIEEINKEFIELKKKKAEKMAQSIRKYHKKSVESTLEAFDKYCDTLSTP